MSTSQDFTPQRHELHGPDAAPGFDTLGDRENALLGIEKELHLDVAKRRMLAAVLTGLGWRKTPHLAEHLAWLLARETDALTAYSLYGAVLATHPQRWTLHTWQLELLRTTPFAMMRTVILDDLLSEGLVDVDSAEGKAVLALLDMANPEHRALVTEHRWLVGDTATCDIREVVALLQPSASMPEKIAGTRIIQFSDDPRLETHALPQLAALFRVERHPGLSLKIVDTFVRKRQFQIDPDMIAFLIRAWHGDGIPASKTGMGSVFHGVEGFLMDSFMRGEQRQSTLTDALLASFAPVRLPPDGTAVIEALTVISTDVTTPFAAFAATAALGAIRQPNDAGTQLVLETARSGEDPVARALAIRVLGTQPRALLQLIDVLKERVVAPDADPRVRRAAFHALINTHQSGLPTRIPEVIDLYFRYLTEAPFDHFGDALHGSDVGKEPELYLRRLGENLGAIGSASARQAAFNMISNPFGFGIAQEFAPHWAKVVQLMLRALDNPRDGDLHYSIFWNMLNDVAVPEGAAAVFASGLKDRLARVKYTKRSRGLIEHWLGRNSLA
jgi:hypothetical protein